MKAKKNVTSSKANPIILSGGFRGQGFRYVKQTRRIAVGVLVLAIVLTALIVAELLSKPVEKTYDESSAEYKHLYSLQQEPVPASAKGKFDYYTRLGSAYSDLGDNKKALELYLKADGIVMDRTIATGRSANVGIASLYQALGNKWKAREYYQREIDRIQKDPTASENAEVIKLLQSKKDGL